MDWTGWIQDTVRGEGRERFGRRCPQSCRINGSPTLPHGSHSGHLRLSTSKLSWCYLQSSTWLCHVCHEPMNFLALVLKNVCELFPFPFPSFPIIKSDTKLCHFFLLYIFPRSSLPSFYAPLGEVQLASPRWLQRRQLAPLTVASHRCPEHPYHDRKMNLPNAWLPSSHHIATLHQIQTPLLALKSSAVWAQSLCGLVLIAHLILQTGWCPVPRKCQPHAHLSDTAGHDLFPAGVSLTPSPFQPGEGATQTCACPTPPTPGVNTTQLSTKWLLLIWRARGFSPFPGNEFCHCAQLPLLT